MVTVIRIKRFQPPLASTTASVAAIVGGLSIGILCLAMPAALLEQMVAVGGGASRLAKAEPALGMTARIALALALGGGCAGLTWCALGLFGGRRFDLARLQRRGDIHPDAPPRPPLLAGRDLGTPFLEVRAAGSAGAGVVDRNPSGAPPLGPDLPGMTPPEQALPVDLNQPMGVFDPGALLAQPFAAAEPVVPLAPSPELAPRPALIDPGDRIETFELTPIGRPAPQPLLAAPKPAIAPEAELTVHELLARLERDMSGCVLPPRPASIRSSVVNRAPVPPAPHGALANALSELRRLAAAS